MAEKEKTKKDKREGIMARHGKPPKKSVPGKSAGASSHRSGDKNDKGNKEREKNHAKEKEKAKVKDNENKHYKEARPPRKHRNGTAVKGQAEIQADKAGLKKSAPKRTADARTGKDVKPAKKLALRKKRRSAKKAGAQHGKEGLKQPAKQAQRPQGTKQRPHVKDSEHPADKDRGKVIHNRWHRRDFEDEVEVAEVAEDREEDMEIETEWESREEATVTKRDFAPVKVVDPDRQSRLIRGMIMLTDHYSFDREVFTQDFEQNSEMPVSEMAINDFTITFKADGEHVSFTFMPFPVPPADIEKFEKYTYYWPSVVNDTKNHKGHIEVSVMPGSTDQVKRYRLFTHVICSLFRTTPSLGIYMGEQGLLISVEQYLSEAQNMGPDTLPLNLWVYFGLGLDEGKNCAYTTGMKEFYKQEMEIIKSEKSLLELREFLYSITHYVIEYDTELKAGETCGLSASERVPVQLSRGRFVRGETLKLVY